MRTKDDLVERMIAVLNRFAVDDKNGKDWIICSNADGTWTGFTGESTDRNGEPCWEAEATGTLTDVLLKLVIACQDWSCNMHLDGVEFYRLLLGICE